MFSLRHIGDLTAVAAGFLLAERDQAVGVRARGGPRR